MTNRTRKIALHINDREADALNALAQARGTGIGSLIRYLIWKAAVEAGIEQPHA
jgi:hypothetical protein